MSGLPTERFSDRVAAYVAARPDYPPDALALLGRPGVVADVGAGTGILSRLLLDGDWTVHAIEPNAEMAAAALAEHGGDPAFHLHAAPAEATGLPAASVDLITAAQAFHWFEPHATRQEWLRILRPGGHVALFWNDRAPEHSPLLQGYEALIQQFGTDYHQIHHRRVDASVLDPFFAGEWRTEVLPHAHVLDRLGLRARLLSCSYIPGPESAGHAEMLQALDALFDRCQRDGQVEMPYRTRVCLGRLRTSS